MEEQKKRNVCSLLQAAEGSFLSGEEMAAALGISRAAVWKQVKRLRGQGYEIEAVTNVGYRMVACPDTLDVYAIKQLLGNHPWRDTITVLECVDSTNSLAKVQALQAAPHGSVYMADEQTGGRGRLGRSFISPRGEGLYFSLLLRPDCRPAELPHITAMVAVAACNALEEVCSVRPQIKWTNDLLLGEKKIGGILTELTAEWESETLSSLVIGIGINCNQRTFPEELRDKATSLKLQLGHSIDRQRLAVALIEQLHRMSQELFTQRDAWMARYAGDCITIGRLVRIHRGETVKSAIAIGINSNGALLVRYDSGETGVVVAGEVSVRGEHGYL